MCSSVSRSCTNIPSASLDHVNSTLSTPFSDSPSSCSADTPVHTPVRLFGLIASRMSILLPFLFLQVFLPLTSSCAFSAFTSKTPAEITKYFGADIVAVTDRYDAEALQSLIHPPEPDVYEEALGSEDHLQWLNVMNEEYESLMMNKTWKLSPLPTDRKPVQCQ